MARPMLLHNTYICCATYGLPDTNFLQERSGEARIMPRCIEDVSDGDGYTEEVDPAALPPLLHFCRHAVLGFTLFAQVATRCR